MTGNKLCLSKKNLPQKLIFTEGQLKEKTSFEGYHPTLDSPLWTTLKWVPTNFRISKNDSSRLCRIPKPSDSKSWGILEFCETLNCFHGIPVTIYKIQAKRKLKSTVSVFKNVDDVRERSENQWRQRKRVLPPEDLRKSNLRCRICSY